MNAHSGAKIERRIGGKSNSIAQRWAPRELTTRRRLCAVDTNVGDTLFIFADRGAGLDGKVLMMSLALVYRGAYRPTRQFR